MSLGFRSRFLRLVFAGAITILGLVIGNWWMIVCGLGLVSLIGLNRIWQRHAVGSFMGGALVLLGIAAGLAALLVYVLTDPAVPKGTSVPLALIGLLPVSIFAYLAFVILYGERTGRRPPGADGLARLLARLNRPL